MREILFRGKRVDNGEWVYGDLLNLHNGDEYIINNKFGACIDDKGNFINTESPFVCKVIPETVGQFTGLTDKNGSKIFEGDIIADYFGRIYGAVEYGEGHFDGGVYKYTGFFVKTKEKEIFYDGNIFDEKNKDYWDSHKVIGNIYDNPELLGE